MSPSSFHRDFKAVTSITPLHIRSRYKLLEARRLMISEAADADTAAYKVGYVSSSQFSREHSRMFAISPRPDAVAFQRTAA